MVVGKYVAFAALLLAFLNMLVATKKLPKWKYFTIAFIQVFIAGIAAIIEEFFMSDLMIFIDHTYWAVGAITFCWAINKFVPEKVL